MDPANTDADYQRRVQEGLELQKSIPVPDRARTAASDTRETVAGVADLLLEGIAGLIVATVGLLLALLRRRRSKG